LLKADLHVHTEYSMDCEMRLEKVISRCPEVGIDCVAIADHDAVEGGLKLQKIAPFRVIVAEEILTPIGEIIGMFLTERIPSGVSAEEAIARIKDQGGLVCLPHPFDRLRHGIFSHHSPEHLLSQVDIVEVFNARIVFPSDSNKAKALAQKYGLPGSAGSDAHLPSEIGNAYVQMSEFNSPQEFCSSLAQGEIFGHRSGIWVHIPEIWVTFKKHFLK
jgi:hypothetical protein